MDPITLSLLVGGGSALVGQLLGGGDRAHAEEILNAARDEFGRIDPAKLRALVSQDTQIDPQADAAQRDSLNRMGQEVESGGMGLQDRAALNEALGESGRQDRAQRAATVRDFGRGSSQGLLATLVGQQGAAQNANRAGLDAAGQAQQRYWQAVRDRGTAAGNIADRRSAIDRWNGSQRMQAAQGNNANAQQQFSNELDLTRAKYGVAQNAASRLDQTADKTASQWGGVGAAGAQGILQYDEDQKRKAARGY